MAKKKTSNKVPLPILIIIYAVLLYAIYNSISTLALAIWGDSVMGTVDFYSSRLENRRAEQNRSRTVFKSYWFVAKGKEYRGYVAYSSDEAKPSLAEGQTRSDASAIFPFFHISTSLPCYPILTRWAREQSFTISSRPSVVCFCCGLSYAQQRREKEETSSEETCRKIREERGVSNNGSKEGDGYVLF